MVMSVLVKDVEKKLDTDIRRSMDCGDMSILLYADDTVLIGRNEHHLQQLLNAIAGAGANMGMELHWDKFQLLQINCQMRITDPAGKIISPTPQMKYLGAILYDSGDIKPELGRRLGAAWGEFQRYAHAWKHTAVSKKRKLEVFSALITSKVLYSLSSAWLNKAERRRIDGFQARCLRLILGIAHPYISRVSNKRVLQQSGQKSYSSQLLRQQLVLFGKICRSHDTDALRQLTFQPSSPRPATDSCKRPVGRPRHGWTKELYRKIRCRFSSDQRLYEAAREQIKWREFCAEFAFGTGEDDLL